jgi:hypothetical protein
MYSEMTAEVKWAGLISEAFKVEQGLLQGGVTSGNMWKVYENPLLLRLQASNTGLKVGTVYLGTVTIADDKALLDKTPSGLQMSLDAATHYANNERYVNGIEKSQIHILNTQPNDQHLKWHINGESLKVTDQYTHLGLNRTYVKNSIASEVIQKARRTAYALMGAGLHGTNGVNPMIAYKLWKIYVIPRCIYGLECLNIPKKEIETIERYERKFLKQIMGLAQNTVNPLPYLLLGALPITTYIHKRRLGLIGAIVRKEDSTEYQLAHRQLATRSLNEDSWFQETERLLLHYGLPSTHNMLFDPPEKEHWKIVCKQAIEKTQYSKFHKEMEGKKLSRFLNAHICSYGKTHPIWATVDTNIRDVQRAGVKTKLIAGSYHLQAQRAKFNQFANDLCPMCKHEAEDLTHFILKCDRTEDIRSRYLCELEDLFTRKEAAEQWKYIRGDADHLMQVIMDATRLHWLIGDQLPVLIEPVSRRLCYALHVKRSVFVTQMAIYITPRNKKKKKTQHLKRKL